MFTLFTERLLLRDFTEGDWPDLYAIESDSEVARYQTFEPRSPADAQIYVQHAVAEARTSPRHTYDLAIVERCSDHLIGRCGLHLANPQLREGMVWYTLLRARWGRGIIPEAVRCLLDFGFVELKLHRVWADCDPRNRPSYRVLEKLGMRREGLLCENAWVKGEWTDSLIYAILDHEWQGLE